MDNDLFVSLLVQTRDELSPAISILKDHFEEMVGFLKGEPIKSDGLPQKPHKRAYFEEKAWQDLALELSNEAFLDTEAAFFSLQQKGDKLWSQLPKGKGKNENNKKICLPLPVKRLKAVQGPRFLNEKSRVFSDLAPIVRDAPDLVFQRAFSLFDKQNDIKTVLFLVALVMYTFMPVHDSHFFLKKGVPENVYRALLQNVKVAPFGVAVSRLHLDEPGFSCNASLITSLHPPQNDLLDPKKLLLEKAKEKAKGKQYNTRLQNKTNHKNVRGGDMDREVNSYVTDSFLKEKYSEKEIKDFYKVDEEKFQEMMKRTYRDHIDRQQYPSKKNFKGILVEKYEFTPEKNYFVPKRVTISSSDSDGLKCPWAEFQFQISDYEEVPPLYKEMIDQYKKLHPGSIPKEIIEKEDKLSPKKFNPYLMNVLTSTYRSQSNEYDHRKYDYLLPFKNEFDFTTSLEEKEQKGNCVYLFRIENNSDSNKLEYAESFVDVDTEEQFDFQKIVNALDGLLRGEKEKYEEEIKEPKKKLCKVVLGKCKDWYTSNDDITIEETKKYNTVVKHCKSEFQRDLSCTGDDQKWNLCERKHTRIFDLQCSDNDREKFEFTYKRIIEGKKFRWVDPHVMAEVQGFAPYKGKKWGSVRDFLDNPRCFVSPLYFFRAAFFNNSKKSAPFACLEEDINKDDLFKLCDFSGDFIDRAYEYCIDIFKKDEARFMDELVNEHDYMMYETERDVDVAYYNVILIMVKASMKAHTKFTFNMGKTFDIPAKDVEKIRQMMSEGSEQENIEPVVVKKIKPKVNREDSSDIPVISTSLQDTELDDTVDVEPIFKETAPSIKILDNLLRAVETTRFNFPPKLSCDSYINLLIEENYEKLLKPHLIELEKFGKEGGMFFNLKDSLTVEIDKISNILFQKRNEVISKIRTFFATKTSQLEAFKSSNARIVEKINNVFKPVDDELDGYESDWHESILATKTELVDKINQKNKLLDDCLLKIQEIFEQTEKNMDKAQVSFEELETIFTEDTELFNRLLTEKGSSPESGGTILEICQLIEDAEKKDKYKDREDDFNTRYNDLENDFNTFMSAIGKAKNTRIEEAKNYWKGKIENKSLTNLIKALYYLKNISKNIETEKKSIESLKEISDKIQSQKEKIIDTYLTKAEKSYNGVNIIMESFKKNKESLLDLYSDSEEKTKKEEELSIFFDNSITPRKKEIDTEYDKIKQQCEECKRLLRSKRENILQDQAKAAQEQEASDAKREAESIVARVGILENRQGDLESKRQALWASIDQLEQNIRSKKTVNEAKALLEQKDNAIQIIHCELQILASEVEIDNLEREKENLQTQKEKLLRNVAAPNNDGKKKGGKKLKVAFEQEKDDILKKVNEQINAEKEKKENCNRELARLKKPKASSPSSSLPYIHKKDDLLRFDVENSLNLVSDIVLKYNDSLDLIQKQNENIQKQRELIIVETESIIQKCQKIFDEPDINKNILEIWKETESLLLLKEGDDGLLAKLEKLGQDKSGETLKTKKIEAEPYNRAVDDVKSYEELNQKVTEQYNKLSTLWETIKQLEKITFVESCLKEFNRDIEEQLYLKYTEKYIKLKITEEDETDETTIKFKLDEIKELIDSINVKLEQEKQNITTQAELARMLNSLSTEDNEFIYRQLEFIYNKLIENQSIDDKTGWNKKKKTIDDAEEDMKKKVHELKGLISSINTHLQNKKLKQERGQRDAIKGEITKYWENMCSSFEKDLGWTESGFWKNIMSYKDLIEERKQLLDMWRAQGDFWTPMRETINVIKENIDGMREIDSNIELSSLEELKNNIVKVYNVFNTIFKMKYHFYYKKVDYDPKKDITPLHNLLRSTSTNQGFEELDFKNKKVVVYNKQIENVLKIIGQVYRTGNSEKRIDTLSKINFSGLYENEGVFPDMEKYYYSYQGDIFIDYDHTDLKTNIITHRYVYAQINGSDWEKIKKFFERKDLFNDLSKVTLEGLYYVRSVINKNIEKLNRNAIINRIDKIIDSKNGPEGKMITKLKEKIIELGLILNKNDHNNFIDPKNKIKNEIIELRKIYGEYLAEHIQKNLSNPIQYDVLYYLNIYFRNHAILEENRIELDSDYDIIKLWNYEVSNHIKEKINNKIDLEIILEKINDVLMFTYEEFPPPKPNKDINAMHGELNGWKNRINELLNKTPQQQAKPQHDQPQKEQRQGQEEFHLEFPCDVIVETKNYINGLDENILRATYENIYYHIYKFIQDQNKTKKQIPRDFFEELNNECKEFYKNYQELIKKIFEENENKNIINLQKYGEYIKIFSKDKADYDTLLLDKDHRKIIQDLFENNSKYIELKENEEKIQKEQFQKQNEEEEKKKIIGEIKLNVEIYEKFEKNLFDGSFKKENFKKFLAKNKNYDDYDKLMKEYARLQSYIDPKNNTSLRDLKNYITDYNLLQKIRGDDGKVLSNLLKQDYINYNEEIERIEGVINTTKELIEKNKTSTDIDEFINSL